MQFRTKLNDSAREKLGDWATEDVSTYVSRAKDALYDAFAGSSYGREMRTAAFALALAGCAPYIFVGDESARYRLGSVPWRESTARIEDSLCANYDPNPLRDKSVASKWTSLMKTKGVLTEAEAKGFPHNTCFLRNPEGPTRFQAQEYFTQIAETRKPAQLKALDETVKQLNPSYTAEVLEGMTPEWKLGLTLAAVAASGTVLGLWASGAFAGNGGGTAVVTGPTLPPFVP